MSELPKGWAMATVEDLLVPLDDGRLVHQGWSPQCEREPAPADHWGVLKTTAIQAGRFLAAENKRLPEALEPRPVLEVQSGDLLLTCAGPRARCGVACLVRETRSRLMISGKMYRFRVDPAIADPRFIELSLLSPDRVDAIDEMKTGISDSGLNLTHARFRALRLPIAPLSEQGRIVAAIEEAFSKLDSGEGGLRAVRRLLKRMRDAVLMAAVIGRLVPQDSADTPASKLLTDLGVAPAAPEGVPDLPPSWAWVELGVLADVVGGVTKDSKRQSDASFVEVPYLRVANVQRGYLDLDDITTIRVAPEKAAQLELLPGDVLFNEGGDRDKLGRGWVWEGQIAGCIHPQELSRD